jgi:hypothetical protein
VKIEQQARLARSVPHGIPCGPSLGTTRPVMPQSARSRRAVRGEGTCQLARCAGRAPNKGEHGETRPKKRRTHRCRPQRTQPL